MLSLRKVKQNVSTCFYHLLNEVFWHIKWGILTAQMRMLKYVLGSQETYKEKLRNNPSAPFLVPYYLRKQEMYDAAVLIEPYFLANVPNRYKTRKMCDKAVMKERFSL